MATPPRARPRRTSATALVPKPRRAVVRGEVVTPWTRVAAVVRLTSSILRTHRATSRANAKATIALGRQLAKVQAALETGQWLEWVDEAVPFTPRTVQNYLALAAWADREPAQLARFGHLGPSKLYRIASLGFAARDKLKVGEPIRIPGAGRKLLEVMTVAELDRVIGKLAPPVALPPPPIDKLVKGYRKKLAALGALNHQLVQLETHADPHVMNELAAELRGLAQEIEAAFG